MKTTNKLGFAVLLAGLFASVASAQLIVTNQGTTAVPSALRSNGGDVATLLSSGLTSFNLGSLASAGTFNEIPVFNDEFRVGFNGTFNVFVEIAFITREAVDNDNLGAAYGFADGVYSSIDPTNVSLFSNYGSLPTDTFRITGAGSTLTDIVNFWHTDTSTGTSADQTNPMFFQWFTATGDANYNYYVARIDDRGSDPSTKDFNDGVFLLRTNTQQVEFTAVPEPSTYALFGVMGLMAVVAVRRIRASRKSA